MSRALWGIDWNSMPPMPLGEGLVAKAVSYDEIVPFMQKNMKVIYEESADSPFLMNEAHPAKENFFRHLADVFGFYFQGELIGFFIGHPTDWSTYYFRNCSVLPQFQNLGLLQAFGMAMGPTLIKAGVERVYTEISPSNLRNIHLSNKYQFNVTGYRVCERFGLVLQFTKFISPKHEAVFLKQFCAGVKPQLTDPVLKTLTERRKP